MMMPIVAIALFAQAQTLQFLLPEDLHEPHGVVLQAQPPESRRMLVPADPARPKLWYAPVSAHADGDLVRIWYQRVDKDEPVYRDQRLLCVGELRAGQWGIPRVGDETLPWGGPDNTVMRRSPDTPTWGGFNVFQILRDGAGYHMLYWDQPGPEGKAGAMTAHSPDGLSWKKDPGAVFTETNDAFSLVDGCPGYRLYQTVLEDWPDKPYPDNLDKKRRVIAVRETRDLRAWPPPEPMLRPDSEDAAETEFYLMKVFRHGHAWIGIIMKYYADPALPGKHSAILKHELAVSADGRAWQRPFRDTDLTFWPYADPFLQNGRLCFVTWKDRGIELITYRPRRLVAAQAESGTFLTQPFAPSAAGITLDADARAGAIEITLTDAAGNAIASIAPARIAAQDGENLAVPLDMKAATPPCRLRVRLENAKLYAVCSRAD